MLLPVRRDDPNRAQKEYYRRKREERCAYQRAYEARRRRMRRASGLRPGRSALPGWQAAGVISWLAAADHSAATT